MAGYGRGNAASYNGRRRPYRKYGSYSRVKKRQSTTTMAAAAYKGVKQLKRLINSERFYLDTGATSSALNTSGFVYNFTEIANGDGQGARTGNSILVESVRVKGAFQIHASATISRVRLMIVRDIQQVADTSPTIAQVLDTVETFSVDSDITIGRFQVLADHHCWLGSTSNQAEVFDFDIPINKHARFNGTASSDIQKGGIYLLAFSSEATNTVGMVWMARTVYYDN